MSKLDEYYALLDQAREACRTHDYNAELRAYRQSIPLLGALVNSTKRQYGAFDLSSIPPIEDDSRFMAVVDDVEGLRELRWAVSSKPELEPWTEYLDKAQEEIGIVRQILRLAKERPGVLQKDLKNHIESADGRRLGTLCSWLERFGRLRRVKHGNSYALFSG